MKLHLQNVGIIKDSEIELDGLTVITGKNKSGKTTIGRTIYSLFGASHRLEESFDESKTRYIRSQMDRVARILSLRGFPRYAFQNNATETNKSHVEKVLFDLENSVYRKLISEDLYAFLSEAYSSIQDLTFKEYSSFIKNSRVGYPSPLDDYTEVTNQDFDKKKINALEVFVTTISLLNDKMALYNFWKDRTKAFLNQEFDGQIKPVKNKRCVSTIELSEDSRVIVSIKVKSKENIEILEGDPSKYPFDHCVFIDDPHIIDRLENESRYSISFLNGLLEDNRKSLISNDYIRTHNDELKSWLLEKEGKNYFESIELQIKLKDLFSQINQIVPGEFSRNRDGFFYVEDGAQLSLKNLATGSKMFFIIKKLLINGLIDNNTFLVLDEPEAHLHPEWINRFAEILVSLIKGVGVNVLLTTHSPNLMLALSVYSRKAQIASKSHFYLAENLTDSYYSRLKCIDDNIGEGYSHLSIPLVEMNLKLEELNGD